MKKWGNEIRKHESIQDRFLHARTYLFRPLFKPFGTNLVKYLDAFLIITRIQTCLVQGVYHWVAYIFLCGVPNRFLNNIEIIICVCAEIAVRIRSFPGGTPGAMEIIA